jgi:hypothetical protein
MILWCTADVNAKKKRTVYSHAPVSMGSVIRGLPWSKKKIGKLKK